MRGFISLGKPLIPTFYTEDYYNLSALGDVVCFALDAVAPLCSAADFKWYDWYGLTTNWLPENPSSLIKIKEHLQSDKWFYYEPFIMYIIPNDSAPPWQIIVYYDYDEEKEQEFADCRIGLQNPLLQEISIRLQEIGFTEHQGESKAVNPI